MPDTYSIKELRAQREAAYERSLQLTERLAKLQGEAVTTATEINGLNATIADLDNALTILEAAAG